MLEVNIIEPVRPYCSSSIVLLKKKDGTTIFCVDFRLVNLVTKFDTKHIENP